MSEFSRMTIVAAAEVVADFNSHDDMSIFEVQWDIESHVVSSSKSARAASWARVATSNNHSVMTESGHVPIARAIVEVAIRAPENTRKIPEWSKLLAGLRFDGFEIISVEIKTGEFSWDGSEKTEKVSTIRRMLPEYIPKTDFREAASEIEILLDDVNFPVAKGHLKQAFSAFQRGEWSSANGELRKFYENYLNEIAAALGYSDKNDSKLKRDFLGSGITPPFLLTDYNEWHQNNQKPQYVQGLMSRMHPHGGHPGLSEEEDATFRLQISLITARLFLRRFKQRTDS